MQSQKKLTPGQAWEKVKHFCAYQERCHSEVMERLRGYAVYGTDADQIVARLIEEGFLNEERFAVQYAGGHFRTKQWGRIKIQYALRQKQVSDWCIRQALATIADDDYQQTFEKLATAKWKDTARNTPALRWGKTTNYLLQKGYESDLILGWLKTTTNSKSR